jgi:carbon monoxide dehydrogenase subunit G
VQLRGTREFDAPRETVWEVLNDPHRLAAQIPHVDGVDVRDDDHWRANVRIPLGFRSVHMHVTFLRSDVRRPEHAKLAGTGGAPGAKLRVTTQFDLAQNGVGTRMDWQAEIRLGGPLGRFGGHALEPLAQKGCARLLDGLERQVRDEQAAA